ncbi:hypothetical protein H8B06_02130 [Sphingobacterium sp. DN00404]|uniref:Uncharacterized protein n=1 Tax=Sphingobacterium micropteri TaxID=2763501 RepID=A0ABR7YJX4_9SPHI|nr:hypothetical protein [Sphingobacterium micropteri]MBD1431609.1 hypothetical protein [Sphingobacterium micropteri]
MKKFILKNAMALAALAIAGTTLMSFGLEKTQTSFFYEYTSNSTDQEDIQNINNYQLAEPDCEPGEHVCGVNLPTNTGDGNTPVQSEFDAVSSQLWSSEQAGEPASPQISMKE